MVNTFTDNISFVNTDGEKIKYSEAITGEYSFSEDVQRRIDGVKDICREINI